MRKGYTALRKYCARIGGGRRCIVPDAAESFRKGAQNVLTAGRRRAEARRLGQEPLLVRRQGEGREISLQEAAEVRKEKVLQEKG